MRATLRLGAVISGRPRCGGRSTPPDPGPASRGCLAPGRRQGQAGRADHQGGASVAITTVGALSARPYAAGDQDAVLALVEADRLPGQPEATPVMLAEALAGRLPVHGGWWAELNQPRTDVIHDPSGRVRGVVSYATRPGDGAGLILWLHAEEEARAVAEALVGHALGQLGPRTVYAFEFACALTLGLEGLPVCNRPATRRALEAAGFTGRDLWRYIHRGLLGVPNVADARVHRIADVTECADPPGWQLDLRETDGTLVGEATLGRPVDGTGVLWWISTDPAHRGRGLGRRLLRQCFAHLAAEGAREVIAYVDDDAPPGNLERDRLAANRLYDSMGFTELDRLWSFTRRP
ncbi:GNAT family N-acetyltransferase [Actinacidiphila oryziradicis]|uniref:GNAT family N-acetyltransferase n=1 Tax=Actinacidiphila oryziradicis TaxID=2571141 RepID=A0A4U0RL14_9ACTN|nr:GNAT family N-acetyltransferase [Actinacidiphila oryziradicis]